jgi:hypothetical protein
MKVNKYSFYALNVILIVAMILGSYELVEMKTLVDVFIIPAFVISASLRYKADTSKKQTST